MQHFKHVPGAEHLGRNSSAWGLSLAVALGLLLAWLPLLPAAVLLAPVVLVLIFVEPLVGIGLMLFAAPWGALENVALDAGLLDSGQLLFLVTAAAWLLNGALSRRIVLARTSFALPLFLFVGVSAFSLLDAPSLVLGIAELTKWLELGLVMFIVVDRASVLSRRAGRWLPAFADGAWRVLLFLILLAGLSQALIGIWQFGLRETGPEHFQIIGGRFYRAYGTFEQPNPFGGFMGWIASLGIGATLGAILAWMRDRHTNSRYLPWLLFLAAVTVAATLALIFSWSRGAWLGFAAGMAALLFLLPRNRSGGLLLLLVVISLATSFWLSELLPQVVVERVASFTQDLRFGDVRGADINDANYAVLERLAHWQAALDMARYNLWTGVGFGNYQAVYPEYALINWPDALGHAHNYYLNILAETGAPGFVAYGLFWLAVLWQTVSVIRRAEWPERGVALGLLGVWVTLALHHLLDKLYVNNLYLYLGVMLGILHVLNEHTFSKA